LKHNIPVGNTICEADSLPIKTAQHKKIGSASVAKNMKIKSLIK
jgi:hypothetical protein